MGSPKGKMSLQIDSDNKQNGGKNENTDKLYLSNKKVNVVVEKGLYQVKTVQQLTPARIVKIEMLVMRTKSHGHVIHALMSFSPIRVNFWNVNIVTHTGV